MANAAPSESERYLEFARDARKRGDTREAETFYQRAAFEAREEGSSEDWQAKIESERYGFLSEQPFYRQMLARVRDELSVRPGSSQADLCRAVGGDAEQLRWALYIAEKQGAVVRVKSGRSYRLFLLGQAIEAFDHNEPRNSACGSSSKTACKAG